MPKNFKKSLSHTALILGAALSQSILMATSSFGVAQAQTTNESARAETNRNIARCYANAALLAYDYQALVPGYTICSPTGNTADTRNDMSEWVLADTPSHIEVPICSDIDAPGDGSGIFGIDCGAYDVMLKMYKRETSSRIELLFAFQGTSEVTEFTDVIRPGEFLRDAFPDVYNAPPGTTAYDARNIKVSGYTFHLKNVWPWIKSNVDAYRTTAYTSNKSLGLKTTGHSAGGAMAETTALVLEHYHSGSKADIQVDVEGFSFNPVKNFRKKSDVKNVFDSMKCTTFNFHAFHSENDNVVKSLAYPAYKRMHPSDVPANYLPDIGGYEDDTLKPMCGFKPHYVSKPGGGHAAEFWVTGNGLTGASISDAADWFPEFPLGGKLFWGLGPTLISNP